MKRTISFFSSSFYYMVESDSIERPTNILFCEQNFASCVIKTIFNNNNIRTIYLRHCNQQKGNLLNLICVGIENILSHHLCLPQRIILFQKCFFCFLVVSLSASFLSGNISAPLRPLSHVGNVFACTELIHHDVILKVQHIWIIIIILMYFFGYVVVFIFVEYLFCNNFIAFILLSPMDNKQLLIPFLLHKNLIPFQLHFRFCIRWCPFSTLNCFL